MPRTFPEAGGSLEERALRLRGEVAAAEMERQVLEHRLALVRRERIPNVTLSGGTGRFSHFHTGPLGVACPAFPACSWDGTYDFTPPGD